MPIHPLTSGRKLVTLSLLLALLPSAATAAGTKASPTTSPPCPAPCVEDARVRPKATIHDPDKRRVHKAEPVVSDKTEALPTVAPADKQAPAEGQVQPQHP